MEKLKYKLSKLKEYIRNLDSVAVAFSSGVDSTFLLKIAHEVLKNRVIAYTVNSCLISDYEINSAIEFCKSEKIEHEIININVFDIEGFEKNPPDRCYICKKEIFKRIINCAKSKNISNIIEGSNIDDMQDYRPGMIALKELRVKSPLQYAQLSKNDIRKLSQDANLLTYNKQSMACLASRIPYNEDITENKLNMISKSEKLLSDFGFECYRVRIHGDNLARIEINPNDFKKLADYRKEIVEKMKYYGFKYVSLDLEGFRSGSMNEIL